jgi:prolyl oligopeptidase
MRQPIPSVVVCALLACAASVTIGAQPVARRQPVTDRYPGVTVVDPYRWMERDASPELARWLQKQDAHTSAQLDQLPGRQALRARVLAAAPPDDAPRRVRRGGQRLFYLRRAADSLPASLRWFELESGAEHTLATDGAVERYDPAPDGTRVALTYPGGGTVQIVGVSDGGRVDSLPAGARFVGWAADARAVTYAIRHGARRELREHVVSTAQSADRVLAVSGMAGAPAWRDDDVLGWRAARMGADAALIVTREDEVVSIHVGSVRRSDVPARRWRLRADTRDSVTEAAWSDDRLVVLGRTGLVVVDAASGRRDTILASRGRALLSIASASDGLYLLEATGGEASLLRLASDGRTLEPVALPISGSGRALFASGDQAGVVLPIDRWLGDGGWYLVAPQRAARLALTRDESADGRYLVERRLVRAADGTEVPMTMIRRRDLARGSSRLTWLMAYGAYGIAMTPLYQSLGPGLTGFLDDGGVYAVAHVRGGGEFGADWHDAGRAARKPNGYRDLIACAEALVSDGWARSERLVIEGASGGGATVGMAGAMRPDLFRVVITNVPDANTLRLHVTPDGPYMREEWGDIRTRAGSVALAAMDVAGHVRSGVSYPAWFASTGLLDTSVPPWQPAKLVASLQRVSTSGRPVLLRVFADEGHVFRPAAQVAHIVDMLAFAYWQTGEPTFQPVGR